MENVKNVSLQSGIKILKIELNPQGDYVTVAAGGASADLFDRFVSACGVIMAEAEKLDERIKEIDTVNEETDIKKKFESASKITKLEIEFAENANSTIDGVFGKDTMKKYLRNIYEEIPDFIPSSECFLDFIDQLTPHMEEIFGRKSTIKSINKEKMNHYKPQDFKKKNDRKTTRKPNHR